MASYKMILHEDGTLRAWLSGDIDEETALAFMRDRQQIFDESDKPIPGILFLNEVTKISGSARRIMRANAKNPKNGSTAIVGISRYLQVAILFVIKASGRDDVLLFDTEEEAVAWLETKAKVKV